MQLVLPLISLLLNGLNDLHSFISLQCNRNILVCHRYLRSFVCEKVSYLYRSSNVLRILAKRCHSFMSWPSTVLAQAIVARTTRLEPISVIRLSNSRHFDLFQGIISIWQFFKQNFSFLLLDKFKLS